MQPADAAAAGPSGSAAAHAPPARPPPLLLQPPQQLQHVQTRPDWSALPREIVAKVMAALPVGARARMARACKAWRLAAFSEAKVAWEDVDLRGRDARAAAAALRALARADMFTFPRAVAGAARALRLPTSAEVPLDDLVLAVSRMPQLRELDASLLISQPGDASQFVKLMQAARGGALRVRVDMPPEGGAGSYAAVMAAGGFGLVVSATSGKGLGGARVTHLRFESELGGASALAPIFTTSLVSLGICYAELTDAGAAEVALGLAGNVTLRELDLSHNNIGGAGCAALAGALGGGGGSSGVRVLELSDNGGLGDAGWGALADALRAGLALESLSLSSTGGSAAGFALLAAAVEAAPAPVGVTLARLDVSRNNLGGDAFEHALHRLAGGARALAELDVRGCNLRDAALAGVPAFRALRVLNASDNYLGLRSVKCVANALAAGAPPLREVVLSQNAISSNAAVALAAGLRGNGTLLSLRLDDSHLADEGATELAAALPSCALEKLDLRDSLVYDAGVAALAAALPKSRLSHLMLGRNAFGDDGAAALAQALSSGATALTHLDMSGTDVGAAGARALAGALSGGAARLTDLNLARTHVRDDGAAALLRALGTNTTLRRLDMSGSGLRNGAAVAAALALNTNETLQVLRLRYNSFSTHSADMLATAVASNDTLQQLDVGHCMSQADQARARTLPRARAIACFSKMHPRDARRRKCSRRLAARRASRRTGPASRTQHSGCKSPMTRGAAQQSADRARPPPANRLRAARRPTADRPRADCGQPADSPRAARRPPADRPRAARRPPAVRPRTARGPPAVRPRTARRPPADRPRTARRPPLARSGPERERGQKNSSHVRAPNVRGAKKLLARSGPNVRGAKKTPRTFGPRT